ncbi:MAG: Maf family protein [Candidatus Krumholzibacteria bacterium]
MNPLVSEEAQSHLILGSRSPRRRDIMRGLDFEFEVVPPDEAVEERAAGVDGEERPLVYARLKARDVGSRYPGARVIGADTVVILGNELLEKPRDDEEASAFLEKLSGQVHTVVTGVVVRRHAAEIEVSGKEITRVHFRELTRTEIEGYVTSGEGRDKAGAYAVQGLGAGLVRSIEGCFYNVVGLPVSLLLDLLRKSVATG